MSNRRDVSERKGSKVGIILVLVLIGGGLLYGLTQYGSTTTFTSETSTSSPSFVSEEVADPYDDIRKREDIKRQQELIVLETFLNEERERVEQEKADAIKSFDDQIAALETKLEEVRGEKLSFQ